MISSELLNEKKDRLEKLLSELKNKIDKSLWAYLDILLLVSGKNPISDKAKENLLTKINNNDLQKLILLQHEINRLEQRVNELSQQKAEIEVLPPSY